MQNKKTIGIIILGVIVIAGLLVYFLFNTKEKTNWEQHYKEVSKDPYGTSVLYGLLQQRSGGLTDVNTDYLQFIQKHASKDTSSNIVLVNRYAFLSDTEATLLMDWAGQGNTVFMATESIPGELMRKLYTNECNQEWEGLSTYTDSIIHPNFSVPSQRDSLDYTYRAPYQGPNSFAINPNEQWTFFDSKYFCEELDSIIQYGYITANKDSGYVNFVFIPCGKGGFYFHTNPLLFSNYYLRDYQHLKYTSKVFQHLHNGNIYFDKFHKSYQDFNQKGASEGPLVYILSQRSLKYGWYLLLVMTALYILFRAKRKQKPIAILEEKKNTTLEYYKTVGSLYFQQQDPYKISLLMFRMFRIYVKEKYKISIKTNDENTVKLLSTRSKIREEHIEKLLNIDRYVNSRPAISNQDVISYYQKLNYFYLNCK
jgi:hypothetical protein